MLVHVGTSPCHSALKIKSEIKNGVRIVPKKRKKLGMGCIKDSLSATVSAK